MTVVQTPPRANPEEADGDPRPPNNDNARPAEGTRPAGSESGGRSGEWGYVASVPASRRPGNENDQAHGPEQERPNAEDDHEMSPEALLAEFPLAKLQRLEELISNPRWVIPVLPKAELETLLDAALKLAKHGLDNQSEACQRFYREGLAVSFTKVMTDEAVSSWRLDIHRCILRNAERLMELCVMKLFDDSFPLLDLLALVLNPANKFHVYTATRQSESSSSFSSGAMGDQEPSSQQPQPSPPQQQQPPLPEPFARSFDARQPRGWLVDLLNRFGALGGFERVLERFTARVDGLTVPLIHALVRPFGQCAEFLTQKTITTYLLPVVKAVPERLESLNDSELKKETKTNDTIKNDALSTVIKALKSIASCVPGQEETVRQLEMFRLKMILRQLQVSSFGGKMNALNEVNRVISSVSFYSQQQQQRHTQLQTGSGVSSSLTSSNSHDDDEFLTADRVAAWLKENRVLQIVLQDSLHQPQYVEKLEKVIRFVIKEKMLSLSDLDDIWAAQAGQHEAIVKNVHELLAKLAWDFSPEQLDHLFACFQSSWSTASPKQREKLLELIRRLAEDDKDGVMAEKVLSLFWSLAHSRDTTIELLDQALAAHVKILDYSCNQYRETQKTRWLDRCVEELKTSKTWVLPALKHIREICCLYPESSNTVGGVAGPNMQSHGTGQRNTPTVSYRHEIINKLQHHHALVILVADNLTNYMDEVRQCPLKIRESDPAEFFPDGRYNHIAQVQERLNFLRFLLRDGQLWLCAQQARQIWHCLAESAVFVQDREACFKWFSKLMGEEPDLDPEINKDFFENNILQLDAALMTESGIKCFDRFFKAVNCKEGKLIPKRRAYLMDDLELIGLDYMWKLILCGCEEIANKTIDLLKETFTNLGPRLQGSQVDIHEDFVSSCMDRLKASYDTVTVLEKEKDTTGKLEQELTRLCRVLKVLHEYVMECDADYCEERLLVPLHRASRGKQLALSVRFSQVSGAASASGQGQAGGRQQVEDLDFWTHTNDTLGSLRRQILQRLKVNVANSVKLELYYNGDLVDSAEDRKILALLPFKDKSLLTCKLCPIESSSSHLASSPDSSSDSSSSSPRHQHTFDGPNLELEQCLPGAIMASQKHHTVFLLQLADLGSHLTHLSLQEAARAVLRIIPADADVIERLHMHCKNVNAKKTPTQIWEDIFFTQSPNQTLYNLEVCYSLLMPSLTNDKTSDFQMAFIRAKGIPAVVSMLTRNNFLAAANLPIKRSAYLTLLKLCKFMFIVAGHSLVYMVADACQPDSTMTVTPVTHNAAVILQQALQFIPAPGQEVLLRSVAQRMAQQLLDVGAAYMPDHATINAMIRMAWAAACGDLSLATTLGTEELHVRLLETSASTAPLPAQSPEVKDESVAVCVEALETLTLALALLPSSLDQLSKDRSWHNFIIDLVLVSPVAYIRQTAAEQFVLMAGRCSSEQQPLRFFTTLLFTVLNTSVAERASQSAEYFLLLSRLLAFTSASGVPMSTAENQLNSEVAWLRKARDSVRASGSTGCDENLLEGHLLISRELVNFLNIDKRLEIGAGGKSGISLVKELLDDFLFPSSRMIVILRTTGDVPMDQVTPVCTTPATLTAAFDLLVSLSTACPANLREAAHILTEMFYTDKEDALQEWEYLPPVGPRPNNGFVGLKNAGATCYMNSVLQQLYMIDNVREGVLSVDGACNDPDEDFSGEEREDELVGGAEDLADDNDEASKREYNIIILKQVQAIFAHLALTRQQFYVPRGLWRHFRMFQGEPVNLREQQDAVEFFMRLIDLVDEAMKGLGFEQRMTKVLGGVFSDQKICRTCPHRYSREQPFSVLNVDIKNFSTLADSLHEYVKGELLDGSNAYYCERCDKKVDTIKRLCVKKLPPVLVIQLKRFDYDYERECAIKFNDYFEFPRELDMEPYTVAGLAKIEGEPLDPDDIDPSSASDASMSKYRLRGMVVHSGQASGGHYYSYIRCSRGWFKFDDGDVSEARMDDDEELKAQCYGGEYMSEVFDPMLKRMSYRKQKRWWNAYMLFYGRCDIEDASASVEADQLAAQLANVSLAQQETSRRVACKIPLAIERSIQKQNVRFMHHKNQYSAEYFQFMRKLIGCNGPYVVQATQQQQGQTGPGSLIELPDLEDLAMNTIQLASKFLFLSGFRTKKSLRGPAQEWYEILSAYFRFSKQVRLWFCQKCLFAHPARFSEYILECPSAEVRMAFVRLIVYIAHFAQHDGPCPVPQVLMPPGFVPDPPGHGTTLSDHLLQTVLALLHLEVSEHGRHLPQYFTLFVMYASLGNNERAQLLKLNVAATFISVALDEGPGPPIKYQYAELAKLYQVVSQLVRCCDVSSLCQSAVEGRAVMQPNPFAEASPPILPVQTTIVEMLYQRQGYLKKLVEEAVTHEETRRLFQFCSWENPQFSHQVLHELLWQVSIAYTHELRPHLDLLLHLLLIEDSWQTLRVQRALLGVVTDDGNGNGALTRGEGLFDTIQKAKSHYQKRGYQCIKLLVALFTQCAVARQILDTNADVRRRWGWSVDWLSDELEQRGRGLGGGAGGGGAAGAYGSWSPPAQSNETANGYFLERSHSAKVTLEKACELLPEEDLDSELPEGEDAAAKKTEAKQESVIVSTDKAWDRGRPEPPPSASNAEASKSSGRESKPGEKKDPQSDSYKPPRAM